MMNTWVHITNLASVTTMGVVTAVTIAGLAAEREWRTVLYWSLLLTAAMVLVLASKIAFIGWGIGIQSLDFTGFSGHATRATAIAPVLFYLLLQRATWAVRVAGVLLGLAFGAAIAVSRLALHTHSISEVVAGCALGGAISLAFIAIVGNSQKFVLNFPMLVIALMVIFAVPQPQPNATQRIIVDISLYLSGHQTPFERGGRKCAPSGDCLSK